MRLCLVLLAVAFVGSASATPEVLRTPPPEYVHDVAPLLTPLAPALKNDVGSLEEKAAAVTLLNENIIRVHPDGRRLIVQQSIYRSRTDAGAHENGEQVFTFRKNEQRFYLLCAEVIQPDGTIQTVKPDAVLVQTPQRNAEYSLYDDVAEVRVIFPNVKPGSVDHTIIAIEDTRARMPGQFAHTVDWWVRWPIAQSRTIIDVARELAGRVRTNAIGAGAPPVTRESLPGGALRLQIERRSVPPVLDQYYPAPANQIGPCIHITTIADWTDVGRWYSDLLRGRDRLSPDLAKRVDAWAASADKPADVLGTVFAKVADDVRYTGLEFGEADYQPHDCNEVWEKQYGDCKDKANLLAVALRHLGIDAHVALLNTTDAGLIDRRSPDYNAFSHAIVALPDGHGGYRFCDPTLSHAAVDTLSPSDCDRDIFVVTDSGGGWARTPARSGGKMGYDFALELKPSGELSGWLTVMGDGSYGADYLTSYGKLDHNETRSAASELLHAFLPGAELIDVEKASGERSVFKLRVYFVVAHAFDGNPGRRSLSFPDVAYLFRSIGFSTERESPLFLYTGEKEVTFSVKLPAGTVPAEFPPALQVDTPGGMVRAEWKSDGERCVGLMDVKTSRSVLSPGDFPEYYTTLRHLRGWLTKPIVLVEGGKTPALSLSASLDDFPRLATSQGQFELLEKRYPLTGNIKLRRAALEQLHQYFPDDNVAAFRVGFLLGEVDWAEGRKKESIARCKDLLQAYRADVSADIYAWGETTYAWMLQETGSSAEAADIFSQVADDPTLQPEQKARAAYGAAALWRKSSPDKAIAELDRAAAWASSIEPEIYAELGHVLLRQNKVEDFRTRLKAALERNPAAAEESLIRMLRASTAWTDKDDERSQVELVALIRALRPSPGGDLQRVLDEIEQKKTAAETGAAAREKLTAAFKGSVWLKQGRVDGLSAPADFERELHVAEQNGDTDRCIHLGVQALLALPPDSDPVPWCIRTCAYIEAAERTTGVAYADEVVAPIFAVLDTRPKDDANYQTGRLLRASHLMFRRDLGVARSTVEALIGLRELQVRFRPVAYSLLGNICEMQGDFDGAADAYGSVAPNIGGSAEYCTVLLRAVLIDLHLTRTAAAIRLVKTLAAVDPAVRDQAVGADQIRELIALVQTGKAEKYWIDTAVWWSNWHDISEVKTLGPDGDETADPIIPSAAALTAALRPAMQTNDATGYFKQLRTAASAARWLPSEAAFLAQARLQIAQMAPQLVRPYRTALIALLEVDQDDFDSAENTWERQNALACCYVEDGQVAKGLARASQIAHHTPPDDPRRVVADWTWAYAAANAFDERERQQSAVALDDDLVAGRPVAQRAQAVIALAEDYAALGRKDTGISVIDRELHHPDIAANPSSVTALRQEADRLRRQLGKAPVVLASTAKPSGGNVQFGTLKLSKDNAVQKVFEFSMNQPGAKLTNIDDRTKDAQAIPLERSLPVYPAALRAKKVKGSAVIDFLVDETGIVVSARVVSESRPEFGGAAIAAVAKWRFLPARRGGVNVPVHMQVPIDFEAPK